MKKYIINLHSTSSVMKDSDLKETAIQNRTKLYHTILLWHTQYLSCPCPQPTQLFIDKGVRLTPQQVWNYWMCRSRSLPLGFLSLTWRPTLTELYLKVQGRMASCPQSSPSRLLGLILIKRLFTTSSLNQNLKHKTFFILQMPLSFLISEEVDFCEILWSDVWHALFFGGKQLYSNSWYCLFPEF